jgi:hypothetical protein
VSDADEVGAGTDAGRVPGVAFVTGSGAFAENIRHGMRDRDRDGLSDRTERLLGTNLAKADSDGDRLPDAVEVALGTDPMDTVTDHDGLSDWLEMQYPDGPAGAGDQLGTGMGRAAPPQVGTSLGEAAGLPGEPSPAHPEVLDLP